MPVALHVMCEPQLESSMQSELAAHPQAPPPVTATHRGPGRHSAVQCSHSFPVLPHSLASVPFKHAPPPQQPPWHGEVVLQEVPHV